MTTRFASIEIGQRLLGAALRHFNVTARIGSAMPGRIRRTALGSTHPRDLAVQSGFLRLVSITESAVDALGIELTDASVPQIDQAVRLLVLEKELAATANWQARTRSFKRHHGVDFRKCSDFKYIEGSVEVRNAIAHRLGRLTTRQASSNETAKSLRVVDVQIVDGQVDIDLGHLKECARYSAAFLGWLDAQLT